MKGKEALVKLHDVSSGLGMIKGTLLDANDIGVEISRVIGLGEWENTFIPWVRVRHVTQPSERGA